MEWVLQKRGNAWIIILVLSFLLAAPGACARTLQVGGELRFRRDREDAAAPVYLCPLQRTDIDGDISGMLGRIRVRQVFVNPTDRKIEALYVFPLPENAAVDRMVMTVGRRRVIGVVKEREEARAVYEAARTAGKVASLLDQERPNVFTQSVANILPGAKVVIEISLVQTVVFADGLFTWTFPTVVGPRYTPGNGRVPDAGRVTPPVVPPPTRAGQTLGLTLRLSTGGLPLTGINSDQHAVRIDASGSSPGKVVVTLANRGEIPNRDFVLHYRVGGAKIGDSLFTYRKPENSGDSDSFFSLLVTPPQRVRPTEAVPKEMVFVIDRSGSMSGFPIEKAKETMRRAILAMNPRDTFNLLSFFGGTGKCFSQPVPNTPQNRGKALKYLADLYGSGGTEMLPAINEALSGQLEDGRIRIVCFMTDGFISNEGEILAAIRKNAGTARVFAFGIGSSVNRFLLDAMSKAGRGAAEYVLLEDESKAAVERFQKRIQSPVLTDVGLDFHGLPVYDVFPKQIPDLFDSSPVIVYGRIRGRLPAKAAITLKGHTVSGDFSRNVRFAASDTAPITRDDAEDGIGNDALVSLWARAKVDDILSQDPMAWQGGSTSDPQRKAAVISLGVQYGLMTPFTSFVAVEDTSYTGDDTPELVTVPVDIPDGVSYEGAVGGQSAPVFATRRQYGITGSMASSAAGASAGPSFAAQPGDPLIRITDAPVDTRLIAAVLPDGTTLPLVRDTKTGSWEAHFDIPLGAAEGSYDVRVILVRSGGERRVIILHYRVDVSGAIAAGTVHRENNGAFFRLEIETDEAAARVTALLPNGERREMNRITKSGTHYSTRVPAATLGSGPPAVTFIITDRAHNRTTITVDGTQ